MLACLILTAVSCGAATLGQSPPTSDEPARAAQAASDNEPPEAEAVRAEHLLPLIERTRTFRVIDGEERDERLPLALRRAGDEEPGDWVLQFSDLNTLYLTVDAEGHVLIVRLDLPHEDMAVVYDPPVRLLPAEIRPHIRIEEQSTARAYDLESGELEHTGEVRHRVRFASRSRFRTDAGAWEGYLIPIEHEIDVPWGDVRLDLAGGYVPELGLVYRRMDYTRESLGLFGETLRRTSVLSEDPD